MPVYAGCELEPMGVERYRSVIRFSARGFSPIRFLLLLFSPLLQFNLLALSTSAVRTRALSLVLGLSFYPLEQAPNMVIYANEQIRDSNERSNLSFGYLPKPRARRAPLLPKNSSAD